MNSVKKNNSLLIIIVLILISIGFIFIYSASSYNSYVNYDDSFVFVKKQLIGFLMGALFMLFTYKFNYHKYDKYKYYIISISIILLMLVFVPFLSVSANGANRWIGVGGLTIQSSEVAKFGFVIFISCYMSKYYKTMTTLKGILPVVLSGCVVCILILLEPNLSVTLCVGMVMLMMLLIGGIKLKYFILLLIPAIALVPILIIIEPYRFQRLIAFINPWANPLEEGYQLIQSLYSLGSGGLFGVGLFNSRQKYLYLPFSESDFIFSIIAEETGFVGSIFILFLYIFLVYVIIRIAINAKDRLGCLIASGIAFLIAFQVLINVAVVSGSIPPTGIPLPFISAGGSSLTVLLGAIGIVLNISNGSTYSEIPLQNKNFNINFKFFKKLKFRNLK